MGSKVRCPACGAKNDATSYRCRMCTVVINADAVDATTAETEVEAAPLADHFDAGVIDRQLQPTRSKFGDDAGGLAARLAAARAAKAANQPIPTSPTSAPTGRHARGRPAGSLGPGWRLHVPRRSGPGRSGPGALRAGRPVRDAGPDRAPDRARPSSTKRSPSTRMRSSAT